MSPSKQQPPVTQEAADTVYRQALRKIVEILGQCEPYPSAFADAQTWASWGPHALTILLEARKLALDAQAAGRRLGDARPDDHIGNSADVPWTSCGTWLDRLTDDDDTPDQ